MTLLLALLVLIVVAALVLAVELLRPEPVSEQGLAELNQALSSGRDYEPMMRLFAERDFRTVAEMPRGAKRLARQRGRVMRLYLKGLRGDFLKAWALCRLLAPISQEADPVLKLFRNWLSFHGLFALVWLKTYTGHNSQAVSQVNHLVTAFGELRQGAATLMQLDAELVASASRV
jgi:hypothetical protein